MKKEHQTINVVLKTANIDIHIVPVVNWLNSFTDVYTCYSCEGTGENTSGIQLNGSPSKWTDAPYVLFYCSDLTTLLTIVEDVRGYATTIIHPYQGMLRYKIEFNSIEDRDQFVQKLKRKENE